MRLVFQLLSRGGFGITTDEQIKESLKLLVFLVRTIHSLAGDVTLVSSTQLIVQADAMGRARKASFQLHVAAAEISRNAAVSLTTCHSIAWRVARQAQTASRNGALQQHTLLDNTEEGPQMRSLFLLQVLM